MKSDERPRFLLLSAVAVALTVGGFFLLRSTPEPAPRSISSVSNGASANEAALAPVPTASGPIDPARASDRAPMPTLDRARADAIRARLKALYGTEPAAATAENKPPGQFAEMPHDDDSNAVLKDYIHQRIKDDYVPLAKSCYENALAKSPTLSGRAVMSFKIVGDRRVGGVVDSVDLDPSSTIHDDEFDQCVKESMMAVSFDAPPDDKPITVKYPLVFSNEPDAG